MTARRLCPLLVLVAALAGCGQGGSSQAPGRSQLPLIPGAQVVAQVQRCDPGAQAFCGLELVVVDRRYSDSTALLDGEHAMLLGLGWSGANGDTGDEHAADSPGHRLRVTYATAPGDLKGIDLEWIKRSWPVTIALSRAMYARVPALSMLLESGSG